MTRKRCIGSAIKQPHIISELNEGLNVKGLKIE